MAKSIRFKNGDEIYTIDPTGVTAKTGTKKSLSSLVYNYDTFFIDRVGGTGVEQYYFLCTLGRNDNGDYNYINIRGTAGGWTRDTLATFDITYSSRQNACNGVWYGGTGAWNHFDFRVYKGSDNYYRIYFHRKNAGYAGDVVMELMSRSDLRVSYTAESTPSGTLMYTIDSSKLTKIG